MANSGMENLSSPLIKQFVSNFIDYKYIVCPSGSCTLFIKEQLHKYPSLSEEHQLGNRIFEFTEFLIDVLNVSKLNSKFPYNVGVHQGCHGLRGLRLGSCSERNEPEFSKVKQLLQLVKGINLVDLSRMDECCGFGGTFCVAEEAVSVRMGQDRVQDHASNGAEVITGTDMSCLMHLEGIIKRQKRNIRVMYLAEVLNAE